MRIKDYLYIVFKSAFLTSIIAPFIILFFDMCEFNFTISSYICRISGIPKDLCLSIMSPGFQNSILILLFVVEITLICYIIDIISKTSLVNKFNHFLESI